MQLTLVFIIVIMSAAISVSILVSYTATISSFFPISSWLQKEKTILTSSSSLILSEVKGDRGDVKPIQIYRTKLIPEIKDYYDILSVSVMKINNKLSFEMDLLLVTQTKMKNMKQRIFGCYTIIFLVLIEIRPHRRNKFIHY